MYRTTYILYIASIRPWHMHKLSAGKVLCIVFQAKKKTAKIFSGWYTEGYGSRTYISFFSTWISIGPSSQQYCIQKVHNCNWLTCVSCSVSVMLRPSRKYGPRFESWTMSIGHPVAKTAFICYAVVTSCMGTKQNPIVLHCRANKKFVETVCRIKTLPCLVFLRCSTTSYISS